MTKRILSRYVCHFIWTTTLLLGLVETAAQDQCMGHVVHDTGTCYTYYNELVTWSEAGQRCRSRGGYLAAFVDSKEQDVLRYVFPGSLTPAGTDAAWIGAYHTKGQWKWVETNEILGPQGCYSDRREPQLRDMEYFGTFPTLTPAMCIDSCRSIVTPKSYEYAGVQGGNQCYCGNITYGRYGTNTECTIKCSDDRFYCGGMLMNSIYKIDAGAYGNWVYAQPNNYKGNQYCGIIDTRQQAKMADESCFEPRAYMCEIPTTRCPDGSSRYYYYHAQSRRCFYINETKVMWYAARQACLSLYNPGPGHLVTIDSVETHEIIKNITVHILPVAQKIWIGLYKGVGWQWSTGANFNFTYWASPSQLAGNPISVNTCGTANVTLGNTWTDTSCADRLPYVCQFAAMSIPTEKPTTQVRSLPLITTRTQTTWPITQSMTSLPGLSLSSMSSWTQEPTTAQSKQTERPKPPSSELTEQSTSQTTTGGTSIPDPTPTFTPGTTLTGDQNGSVTQPLVTGNPGASTNNGSGLSTLELVLAIVMSLLGLLLLILMIYCFVVLCQKRNNKIYYWYDARSDAPVPNSGITGVQDYDKYSSKSNNSSADSTTELHRPGPW